MLFRNFQKTIDAILFGNNKKYPLFINFAFPMVLNWSLLLRMEQQLGSAYPIA